MKTAKNKNLIVVLVLAVVAITTVAVYLLYPKDSLLDWRSFKSEKLGVNVLYPEENWHVNDYPESIDSSNIISIKSDEGFSVEIQVDNASDYDFAKDVTCKSDEPCENIYKDMFKAYDEDSFETVRNDYLGDLLIPKLGGLEVNSKNKYIDIPPKKGEQYYKIMGLRENKATEIILTDKEKVLIIGYTFNENSAVDNWSEIKPMFRSILENISID